MPNVSSLTHVIQRAFEDSGFLQELMKDNNIANALNKVNLALSFQDMLELEKILNDKKEITGRELLELVNSYNTGVISTKRVIPVWGSA